MNWEQFKAILWLRWRLTQNQFRRAGQVNTVLSIVFIVLMLTGGAGCAVGGGVAGWFAGAKAPAPILMLILDGVIFFFLIFWLAGLMMEIQRSESIDLTKLLPLPVTLKQVFVFNFLASHFTPSMVILLPGMAGFCAGMTISAGPVMILLFPLMLSFVFMVSAWTYCLRGWLAALMVNKRRRRAVIVWLTLGVVLLGQMPNIIFNSPWFHQKTSRSNHQQQPGLRKAPPPANPEIVPPYFEFAHCVVPPGWVGFGAMHLKEKSPWPAIGLTAAGVLAGVLGLVRAFGMSVNFYRGADSSKKIAAKKQSTVATGRKPLLVERGLPWLPDDTAALALATFRSLTRAPELTMAFIMPVVMGVIFSALWFTRGKHHINSVFTGFVPVAVVAVVMFALGPTLSNMFGLDRNGFRALVLLPTRRHHILFAKNLAVMPFVILIAGLLLALAGFILRLSADTLLTGLLQVPSAFLLFSLMWNMLSILAPYRFAEGSLKAKKPKAIVFFAAFGAMLLTPLVMLPVLIPPALRLLFYKLNWLPWLPVNLFAAAGLFALIALLYKVLLPLQGSLLQSREQTILREVTEEIE